MARIVINPTTFHNKKDALCVAFNEALRIAMEEMSFEPESEPTEAQREFFSDTEYANDELQLRRTILARICVFDTSVKDPTDDQLREAVMFLEDVMQAGFPQNEWEQSCVQRMHDMVAKIAETSVPSDGEPMPQSTEEPVSQAEPEPGAQAADKGGQAVTDEEAERRRREAEEQKRRAEEEQRRKAEEDQRKQEAALKQTGAYNDQGKWRTQTGQLIGDSTQAGQYLQALNALKGTNAYYDHGVFRTQTGKKIGGDLESVNAYASINKATQGTGAYYDGAGVWRTQTGKRLDTTSLVPGQAQQQTAAQPAGTQTQTTQTAQTQDQNKQPEAAATPAPQAAPVAETDFQRRRRESLEAKARREQARKDRDAAREARSHKRKGDADEQGKAKDYKGLIAGIDAEIGTHRQSITSLEEKRKSLLLEQGQVQ